ncbi:MAG: enoyl-CoA hydratase, partial [Acidimicrobiales bacterium]
MSAYRYVTYETFDEGTIARIMLNRPDARNAQSRGLLVELHDAFLEAEQDDQVRVVILGGHGPMFSSGHDMGSKLSREELTPGPNQHPTALLNGGTRTGAEKRMLQEWHYFFENTLRWRNLRKITVAQLHGTVFAAGLMLAWACDLIVAAEDVQFADVVGTRLGMCGVEYFAHPWELGPRKTKELMLTGDSIDVHEAHRLGMVSKVFPVDELGDRTLEFARRIAQLPTVSALLIKESVNQTTDNMGFYNALNACFTLH